VTYLQYKGQLAVQFREAINIVASDPLLDGDREIGDRTTAGARQWTANRGMVFSAGPLSNK
jgi:hypothetical protein